MYVDRLPPHDVNAEESVIGSLLIDGDSLSRVSSMLTPNDFWGEKNRWCYEAALTLFERGDAINQVTVAHELSLLDRLEEVGGSAYLSHLVMVVPTSVHIEYYAGIVQRTSIMRQLIDAGGRISEIGYTRRDSAIDAALAQAEDLLIRIRADYTVSDFVHIREGMDEILAQLSGVYAPTVGAVPTGFPAFDNLLGNGLQRSDMVVLAARPSFGKTSLALDIARHAATAGNRVGVFSLEMSRGQIDLRLLASEAQVDSYRVRTGLLSAAQEATILDALGALSDMPIYVDDAAIQTPAAMRGKARRLQIERGLDLLIVDYIQLIGGSRRLENRVQEMTEISRSLKGIARDLDIPVIACSQLNRAVEYRSNHRPMLADLRESGSIEQDADVVAFLHREDKYVSREEWSARRPTEPYPEGITEVIVAKHRNGPVGSIDLCFVEDTVSFTSLG